MRTKAFTSAPRTRKTDVVSTVSVDRQLRRRIGLSWRELRRGAAAAKVKVLFYESPNDEPLDLALADALGVLCTQGSMRMGELADALHISPASTTRAVTCLADRGYAERVKADDDQRSILVSATESGIARYRVIAGRIDKGLNAILSEFSPEELEQLSDLLERFCDSVARFSESDEL